MSSTSPVTNETSLRNRPGLRWALIGVWVAVVGFTAMVLGTVLSPQFADFQNTNISRTLLEIPALLQFFIEYGVDLLLIFGFSVIGAVLIVRRSDDWFAIFTSLFLITFGVRVTNLAHVIALMPGYERSGGLILAMGDIGIVLFSMLFPDGKFVPRWLKFVAPLLVATMLGIYFFPNAPFFWGTMDWNKYLLVTTTWYVIGLLSSVYRYMHQATLAQKQQIRWAFIGTMGPFLWFLIFQVLFNFIPQVEGATLLGTSIQLVSRFAGIFMFLMLPLFITISIASAKLFDIDLLINRSLVYGILTIGLGLTFALALGLISIIFRNLHGGDQAFMVATIFSVAAGALFQPARKKLQRFVDRFFYHIKIDYQKTPAEIQAESDTIIKGTTLSSYHDLKLIGRGGMAEVYSATSPKRRSVAIKVLKAELATEEQFRKRFIREAEIVSGLEHPNIVQVLDFGDEDGAYYIVMELLTGPDLSRLLKEEGQLSLPQTVNLLSGIAHALDYAHLQGLVHRDIKPSNVMMDSSTISSRAVLTDFGIAKITDAHTKITNTAMLGTFDYIAPEQIQASAEVDGRADVYALGVMTYQMLTGSLPFQRPNTGALLLAHLNAPPPDARETVHGLPRPSARAIQQAMAKKPADRFQTASEFIAALEGV
ncbi:MAG: serine/threonine protein kinase [Chloroflexi bacterium]|nr:serine/threonine protein kinase [Chloroflexota bacterium]